MVQLSEILAPARLAEARQARADLRDLLAERGCLLFGPGTNGRRWAQLLAGSADAPAAHAFISDVAADLGRRIEGLEVLSRAEALARFGPDMPIINCVYRADVTLRQVMTGLHEGGFHQVWSLPHLSAAFPGVLPSTYGFGDVDVLASQVERIVDACCAFADEPSRDIFASLVAQRVSLDFSVERVVDPAIYFPDFLRRTDVASPGERLVFVDCGAYDGDTVEALARWAAGSEALAVALEPDPGSFARLQAVAARELGVEVQCVQAAAGATGGHVRFLSLGNEASRVASEGEGEVVELVTVDSILADLGVRADYVKYDVEGFERDAIAGTRQAIVEDRAALAVSVYHRPEDLWDILLELRELQPAYRFHLREHGPDGVDTVLYALAR